MLTKQQQQELEKQLTACVTVGEIFRLLQRKYDLDNTTLGMLTKPSFISGIIKGINAVNPKERL